MTFVRGRGGSTTAAVTRDTVTDKRRKKMADGVARSPCRLCSRDGKICCYGDALSTICFLACSCALLPTFLFSLLYLFFPASRHVYILRVPSFVQQSATLSKYVFYSTCSFCLCHLYTTAPSRNYFVFFRLLFFFVALICRVAFFCCCALVPGTRALDLPTLII